MRRREGEDEEEVGEGGGDTSFLTTRPSSRTSKWAKRAHFQYVSSSQKRFSGHTTEFLRDIHVTTTKSRGFGCR